MIPQMIIPPWCVGAADTESTSHRPGRPRASMAGINQSHPVPVADSPLVWATQRMLPCYLTAGRKTRRVAH